MKVMTFNLRNDGFFISNWKKRLYGFIELIKKEKPDIIGTQEMTYKAKTLLEKLFLENKLNYNFYGESRKRNNTMYDEYNTIIVNKKIKVNKTFTYSLSNTPYIPKTKFKKDPFPRIITFVETNDFYIYNTHLTHRIKNNKLLQLDCISNLLRKDKPIIITGDFNLGIKNIKNFCKKNNLINTTTNIDKTFSTKIELYHLDHILVSNNITYDKSVKHDFKYKNSYISDHYPISVNIKISPN